MPNLSYENVSDFHESELIDECIVIIIILHKDSF